MGKLLNVVNPLHRKTARDYIGRMVDDKVSCMRIARQFEEEFWDASRRYGYGGYRYDGRWSVVAQQLIDTYKLPDDARILDIGCGKAFLLYEFKRLLPNCTVVGLDVSEYALKNAKEEVRPFLHKHNAKDPLPYSDKSFDLAYTISTYHNLAVQDLKPALREIERVARHKYLLVESFRDEQELFNLQCWALTCEAFLRPESWTWLFQEYGYTGDYEFIYFEGESQPPAIHRPAA